MKFRLAIFVLLFLAGFSPAQQAASTPAGNGPEFIPLRDVRNGRETFGDEKDIALLMTLAQDTDPLVRERIVFDLGQTHNAVAAGLIEAFLLDADANVRATAIAAAYELRAGDYKRIILKGLKDRDAQVIVRTLLTLNQPDMEDTTEDILPLLGRTDENLQRLVLINLNRFKKALPTETLKILLANPSPAIRLQATQNAMFLSHDQAGGILDDLFNLANKDIPAIRATAITVLGKNALNKYRDFIDSAGKDKNPKIRRGAIWAIQYGSASDLHREFILDSEPMVCLAAIKAAGAGNCRDCVDDIVRIMLTAQDSLMHETARTSLEQIGTAEVAVEAGKLVVTLTQGTKRPGSFDDRNALSACKILSALKSREALDARIQMLRTLPINSDLVAEIAYSIGTIDEKSAIPDIRNLLAKNVANANEVRAMDASSSVLYGNESVIKSIQALVALGDKDIETVKLLKKIVQVTVGKTGLNTEAATVLWALPYMYTDQTKELITEIILDAMDQGFSYQVRFTAMKLAGKYKVSQAVPILQQVLSEREERNTIQAAAWSLQMITGKAVTVPTPLSNPGEWTVQRK